MTGCGMKGAALLLAATAMLAGPAGVAGAETGDGWPLLIGPPLALFDRGPAAEIRITLPRTAETAPGLFRAVLEPVREEMSGFRREAEAAMQEAEEDPDYRWQAWTYEVAFDERYARAPYASLLRTDFTYTGGAHPNTDFAVVNFDSDAGVEIYLSDLFDDISPGSPVLRAIADHVRADLAAQKSERFGETVSPDDEELAVVGPEAATFALFTLEPAAGGDGAAGITVHFPPYAVGAYAEGAYEAFVPAEVFAGHLADRFSGLFGGTRLDMARLTHWEWPGVLVLSDTLRQDQRLTSPFRFSGEAPTYWFHEGIAHVRVTDDDGALIGEGFVTWDPEAPASGVAAGMVRFSGEVAFDTPATPGGTVVFQADDTGSEPGDPVEAIPVFVSFE